MRFVCLSMCVVLLTASTAVAQFDAGAIVGTVRDASNAVVPAATVTLTSTATGISVTKATADSSSFEFAAVKPGVYLVTAEKTGFAIALVDDVQVQVGSRLRVDLQMALGQLQEKVEVSAAQPLVETDSSQRGQVISGDQTRALPLISREYSSLALLTNGVKVGGSALTTGNTPREGAFNVNGLRSVFNNFLIDGVDNNAYGTSNQGFSNQVMQPAPDAIGEFKVVTNNLSAEYGRAAGATIWHTSATAPTGSNCSRTTTRRCRTMPPAASRWRTGARFPDLPTSPTHSTAGNRGTRHSRRRSNGV